VSCASLFFLGLCLIYYSLSLSIDQTPVTRFMLCKLVFILVFMLGAQIAVAYYQVELLSVVWNESDPPWMPEEFPQACFSTKASGSILNCVRGERAVIVY